MWAGGGTPNLLPLYTYSFSYFFLLSPPPNSWIDQSLVWGRDGRVRVSRRTDSDLGWMDGGSSLRSSTLSPPLKYLPLSLKALVVAQPTRLIGCLCEEEAGRPFPASLAVDHVLFNSRNRYDSWRTVKCSVSQRWGGQVHKPFTNGTINGGTM